MDQLKEIFCRYDMVCDNPSGVGFELYSMPEFFAQRRGMETDMQHLHGFYEIIWFQEGSGVHYVDFSAYPVCPGAVFFISPGQIHSFDGRHDQKGVVLKICAELLNDADSDESVYLRYNVFNAFDHLPYCKVAQDGQQGLMDIVEQMRCELQQEGSLGHKDYLRALVRMFIIRVQRSNMASGTQLLDPLRPSHKAFLEFRQLLEQHYASVHTVKEYATMLHITPKTLTQYVTECSAHTPLEIINNRVALEAKRLLRYSVLSIKEIAFRLGFEDPSYFVKFFKRLAGQSPADYRERL